MPTNPVLRRQKAAQVLRSAIETHQALAAESLSGVLTPFLQEGEALTDLGTFQNLLQRLVTRHEEEMVDADEAHEAELKEDREPRRRRDRIARDLTERLRQCRQDAIGAFGSEEAAEFLKLEGSIGSRDAEALLRQVRQVVTNLRNEDLPFPPGVTVTSFFDRITWAGLLEPPMHQLQTAVDELALEVSEDQETRAARTATLRRMDATLVTVSRLMQFLYRLGGHRGFESEVVPIIRRRARPGSRNGDSPPAQDGTGGESPDGSPPGAPADPGGGSPRALVAT